MKLVLILSVILQEILLVHVLEVVDIVRAFRVHALMKEEVFPFLLSNESFSAVGTAQGKLLGEAVFLGREVGTAYFVAELPGFAVIAVEIRLRGTAGRTAAAFRDIAFFPSRDGLDLFTITVFKVRDQELPVPVVGMDRDPWEFINLEFLVFWGMGIIKSPLLEWIYLQMKLISQQFCW